VQSITEFVDQVAEEKFNPIIKSQPIPETQGALKIVVAKNYNEIVEDESKDVFLLHYAPWDMFSKKYLKLFEQLAEQVTHPDLVIAKYDGTANSHSSVKN